MRKIDKSICISTDYQKWIDDLSKKGKPIPAYTSSGSAKYYKDVLAALLHCQHGLCAYTEIRLLEEEKVNALANFIDATGKYIGERP